MTVSVHRSFVITSFMFWERKGSHPKVCSLNPCKRGQGRMLALGQYPAGWIGNSLGQNSFDVHTLQSFWIIKNQQYDPHYSRFIALSFSIANQLETDTSDTNPVPFHFAISFGDFVVSSTPWEERKLGHDMIGKCSPYVTRDSTNEICWVRSFLMRNAPNR